MNMEVKYTYKNSTNIKNNTNSSLTSKSLSNENLNNIKLKPIGLSSKIKSSFNITSLPLSSIASISIASNTEKQRNISIITRSHSNFLKTNLSKKSFFQSKENTNQDKRVSFYRQNYENNLYLTDKYGEKVKHNSNKDKKSFTMKKLARMREAQFSKIMEDFVNSQYKTQKMMINRISKGKYLYKNSWIEEELKLKREEERLQKLREEKKKRESQNFVFVHDFNRNNISSLGNLESIDNTKESVENGKNEKEKEEYSNRSLMKMKSEKLKTINLYEKDNKIKEEYDLLKWKKPKKSNILKKIDKNIYLNKALNLLSKSRLVTNNEYTSLKKDINILNNKEKIFYLPDNFNQKQNKKVSFDLNKKRNNKEKLLLTQVDNKDAYSKIVNYMINDDIIKRNRDIYNKSKLINDYIISNKEIFINNEIDSMIISIKNKNKQKKIEKIQKNITKNKRNLYENDSERSIVTENSEEYFHRPELRIFRKRIEETGKKELNRKILFRNYNTEEKYRSKLMFK